MTLRCKIGDLAIVVNAEQQQNLGNLVEVMGLPSGAPLTLTGPGHVWQVKTVSGRKTLHYRMPSGTFVLLSEGPVPDCRLWPIPGLAVGDGKQEGIELFNAPPSRNRKVRTRTKSMPEVVAQAS